VEESRQRVDSNGRGPRPRFAPGLRQK
jgi:hypothetical protein